MLVRGASVLVSLSVLADKVPIGCLHGLNHSCILSFLYRIFCLKRLLSGVLFPFLAKENKPDLTVFFSHSFSGPFITQNVQWVVFFLVTAHPLPHECAPH